jgi:hypothetical protein
MQFMRPKDAALDVCFALGARAPVQRTRCNHFLAHLHLEAPVLDGMSKRTAHGLRARGLCRFSFGLQEREPQVVEMRECPSLEENTPVLVPNQHHRDRHPFGGCPRRTLRIPTGEVSSPRLASPCQWTDITERRARKTDGLAELHQCLIPVTRPSGVEQASGKRLLRLAARVGRWKTGQAGQNSHHISVDGGMRQVVCDREHRSRRVGSDPGQREGLCHRAREGIATGCHQHPRCPLQRTGARVVAEPRPYREHIVLFCTRQSSQSGKGAQEAAVRGHDNLDAGLLEHHLGHPDPVRISRTAPRQIALVAVIPAQQCAASSHRSAGWSWHASLGTTDRCSLRITRGFPSERPTAFFFPPWQGGIEGGVHLLGTFTCGGSPRC